MKESTEAAIVCTHVAKGEEPIVCAVRDEPVDAADSGWQFLCAGSHVDPDKDAQVWSLSEVIAAEPSLAGLIEAPIGTRLLRQDERSPWQKSR